MHRLFRDTLSVLLLIFISTAPSGVLAGKWKTVSQDETPVLLKGWPSDIKWRFRDGGSTVNYSKDLWNIYSQPPYGEINNRTVIYVRYLNPGFYWGSGYTKDVREGYWFTRKKGWFQSFADATWESGQRFECYQEAECSFRNLKFTAGNETCQWVFDNPDIGTTDELSGRSEEPWSVLIIHCGDTKPFTKEHFERTAETVKISYPGSSGIVSSTQTEPTENPSNLPLDKAKKQCAEIGFTKGTEKFADCVMNMITAIYK